MFNLFGYSIFHMETKYIKDGADALDFLQSTGFEVGQIKEHGKYSVQYLKTFNVNTWIVRIK